MLSDDVSSRGGGDFGQKRISKVGIQNDLLGINLEKIKLDRNEVSSFIFHFKKFDKPIIQFNEFLNIAKKMQYDMNLKAKEFVLKEMEGRGINKITLEPALLLLSQVKLYLHKIDEENEVNSQNEYVDVFVALGGNPDQTGRVSKATILEIIKSEFELTIDMEIFLEKIESQGDQLEFDDFCKLFETGSDRRTLSKNSSVLSLLSSKSRKSTKSNKSMRVKYSDFEKFYAQMEEQEKERIHISEYS